MGKLRTYLLAARLFWSAVMRPRAASWSDSPGHLLVGLIARYCHAKRHNVRLRGFYFRFAAVLKYRELVYIRKLAFVKRLCGRLSVEQMRDDIALWQWQTRREHPETPPQLPVHGIFELDETVHRPFDMLAPVLSSSHFSSLSFVWATQQPNLDPGLFLPVQDRAAVPGAGVRYASESTAGYDIIREVDHQGFSLLTGAVHADAHRKINDLLQAAAPRSLIVAVALEEDDLGFCDTALVGWLAVFRRMRRQYPWVVFCVLNPTSMALGATRVLAEAGVLPARCRGLDDLAVFALPIKADLFFGEHGVFGMVAASASKPGIYFHPRTGDHHCFEKRQWFLANPAPETVVPILAQLIDHCTRPELKANGKGPRVAFIRHHQANVPGLRRAFRKRDRRSCSSKPARANGQE